MDSAEAVIIHNNKVSSNNNYIHDDLAFYILSKLPIKSLKRFECVRKSWSNLLSQNNSHFMTMFRNHFISSSNNNDDYQTFLLMQSNDVNNFQTQFHLLPPDYTFQDTLKLNLPPPFQHREPPPLQILGSTSVNGILCIKELCLEDINKVQFVLWNPATHQFLVLPPTPDQSRLPHPPSLCAVPKFHGFGYDKLRDDFKVFQYVTFDSYDRHNNPIFREPLFGIYSLTNNSWRILDIHMPDLFLDMVQEPEVYLDGMCHMLFPSIEEVEVVFSFDLTNEVTFMTPFDQNIDDALFISPLHQNSGFSVFKRRQLVVLNGSIALISDNDSDTTLQISILGELGVKESWIKLFIIGPIPSYRWLPIGVGKKGYIFFRKEDDELAWLDLSTQIVEEIGVKGEEYICDIGIYKESLLSISGLNNY